MNETMPMGMSRGDFSLGCVFTTGSGERWRSIDIGIDVTVAVYFGDHPNGPSWYNGLPHVVAEHVFDECAEKACTPLSTLT